MRKWQEAHDVSQQHGESFFIFDKQRFTDNLTNFRNAFRRHYPRTEIAYSYKTNYTPAICKLVNELGGYAEVVSEMELDLARRIGISGKKIIYNGPYKSERSIESALLEGVTVNVDSMRDLHLVLRVASENASRNFDVALRCNFPVRSDAESRFGFDVNGEDFVSAIRELQRTGNVRLAGLHCHFPFRDLESFRVRAVEITRLARRLEGPPLNFINIGGGFFGEMPPSLRTKFATEVVTFDNYASVVGGVFAESFSSNNTAPTLFIEPGTALVANTFRFYTKVISTRQVASRNIAVVAGSIFDISPTARSHNLPVSVLSQHDGTSSEQKETNWDVAGYTCIEGDYLTKGLRAHLKPGDYLVYENVGSYSIVMKPPFILPASTVLVDRNDGTELSVIKSRESAEYIFQNFVF